MDQVQSCKRFNSVLSFFVAAISRGHCIGAGLIFMAGWVLDFVFFFPGIT
jgi:hypothetical protein